VAKPHVHADGQPTRIEELVSISGLRSERPIDLCVVVVLYNCTINSSSTCQSILLQTFIEPNDTFIIYDNSPSSNLGSPTPKGWEIVADPSNGGLFSAYSFAVSRAKSKGCPWVLLLDQDTELPEDFLVTVHEDLLRMQTETDVVAIIPTVMAGNRQVSPMLPRLGREIPFDRRSIVETSWLWAINSGTCLRIDFIESIGGFSSAFWLDFLDHWLFKMINNSQKRVFVSKQVLQHELSVSNMNNGLSVKRYQNVLKAEREFTNRYLPTLWRYALVPRLFARSLKHLIMTRNKRLGLLMAAAGAEQVRSLAKKLRWTRHAGRSLNL
jgi:GT2 family glycosyltransferase